MYGLKDTPTQEKFTGSMRERQSMSVLSLEVFGRCQSSSFLGYSLVSPVPTRQNKVPDPAVDEIAAVFFAYQVSEENPAAKLEGAIVVRCPQFDPHRIRHAKVDVVADEVDLINKIVDVIVDLDPDILIGWEIQRASWGYLDARGRQHGTFGLPSVTLLK